MAEKSAVPRERSRRVIRRMIFGISLTVIPTFIAWWTLVWMPGRSFRQPLPDLAPDQQALAQSVARDVQMLAGTIGERNVSRRYDALVRAAEYIEAELAAAGYEVQSQEYRDRRYGYVCRNLEVEIVGSDHPHEIIVVGAHYDSAANTPGANDNASGTAALLALARTFANRKIKTGRTLRFVAFTNEEPPYFQHDDMGSWVYARRCRKNDEQIVAMISLETMGYFSDESGSQQYPPPLGMVYPSAGNFIGVIGNVRNRSLVRQTIESLRTHAEFPSEGGAVPGIVMGVGWSDHWSFWQEGYPAVMVTDTAVFRYPWYHHPEDTPDKIDFERLARVTDGLVGVVEDLAR